MSYPVIKWVKGNPYLYVQESYRVKGQVRTRTLQYLGRATALDVIQVQKGVFSPESGSDVETATGTYYDQRFTSQSPLPGSENLDLQAQYELANPPIPPYSGADSLTLAILEELEGKQFISRQFILDLARVPGLKPAEKELIEMILAEIEGKRVPVDLFARRLEHELLSVDPVVIRTQWEEFQLPEDHQSYDLDYAEIIYAAPFPTPGGQAHYSREQGATNYFAHVRCQTDADEGVRRILELQSDLYQKYRTADDFQLHPDNPLLASSTTAQEDFDRLAAYRKTWWQRTLKEEIRRAARDGLTELHFPTAETAAYIEQFAKPAADTLNLDDVQSGTEIEICGEEVLVLENAGNDILVVSVYDINRRNDWNDIRDDEIKHLANDILPSDPQNYGWVGTHAPNADEMHKLAEAYFDKEYPSASTWAEQAAQEQGHFCVAVDTPYDYTEIIQAESDYTYWHSATDLHPYDPENLDDGQRRVLSFYERDIPKYLKKLGHTVTVAPDDYGIAWHSIMLSPIDNRPIKAL